MMPEEIQNYIASRNPDVAWTYADGKVLCIDLYKGEIYELGEMESLVWRACDGNTPIRQIIRFLIDHYRIDEKTAFLKTFSILDDLAQKELVDFLPMLLQEDSQSGKQAFPGQEILP